MLCGAAIDAHGLTFEAQLAGVASSAGDVQIMLGGVAGILVPGKTDGEVAGVVRASFLLRVDQEAETGEIFRGGEALLGEGQFQCLEPLVTQAFDLRTLGREVVGLPLLFAPLIQVTYLLRRGVEGQFRVGDVIDNHREGDYRQHDQQRENAG